MDKDLWDSFIERFKTAFTNQNQKEEAYQKLCKLKQCRELTTLWVARLNYGAELKVTDSKEQQGDVEEEEAEGKERWDGVDCGRWQAGCCWQGGSFERLQCGGLTREQSKDYSPKFVGLIY